MATKVSMRSLSPPIEDLSPNKGGLFAVSSDSDIFLKNGGKTARFYVKNEVIG